jgi:hypothetical protein
MPVRLQRLRVVDGAEEQVREWLSTADCDEVIAGHRELQLWTERLFFTKSGSRWYLYVYSEADDPTTLGERATAITTPAFVELRQKFRAWFDEAVDIPEAASVLVDKGC